MGSRRPFQWRQSRRSTVLVVVCAAVALLTVQGGADATIGPGLPPNPTGPAASQSPALADAQTASSASVAMAIAAKYGHRVEILSMDDAASTTFANPDGSMTLQDSATDWQSPRTVEA